MKKCTKCKTEKESSQFYPDNRRCDGLQSNCKDCNKLWRSQHKELLRNKLQKWRNENKEHANEWSYNWRCKNPQKTKLIYQKSDKKRRKQKNEYLRQKRKIDPNYKIGSNLRRRINRSLKVQFANKYYKFDEYLGCTLEFFKEYIQSKFTDGMTWELYLASEIHLDHIIPCSLFNLTDPEEQKKCFHYSNIQPLWKRDNFQKSNKLIIWN